MGVKLKHCHFPGVGTKAVDDQINVAVARARPVWTGASVIGAVDVNTSFRREVLSVEVGP